MIKNAQIVFLPYNYILNSDFRDLVADYLKDSIIIFDEGHNVASQGEEGFSFSISDVELESVGNDLSKLKGVVRSLGFRPEHTEKMIISIEKCKQTAKNLS